MKNSVVYITKKEVESIRAEASKNTNIYFVEINGANIKTENDYVYAMSSAFNFSNKLPTMKLGWYNDYICDLMWIKQKAIILLILNYDLMMADNLKLKNDIIADFEDIILPWWEKEIVGHMVGGTPKSFMVYLESKTKSE